MFPHVLKAVALVLGVLSVGAELRSKAKPKRQKQLRPTKYYIMVIARPPESHVASAILISL